MEITKPVKVNIYGVLRQPDTLSGAGNKVHSPNPDLSYTNQTKAAELAGGAVLAVEGVVLNSSNGWTWTGKLSARYYYFAVETAVDDVSYNTEDIVYRYNPVYNYDQFGYVLTGSIIIHHGNKKYRCNKGESFYFSSSKAHFIENPTDRVAKF